MVTIREACIEDAPGIAKVHVDSWRTTYAGIVPPRHLANLSYDRREQIWKDILKNNASYIYVAVTDSGQIVGFVSGGPERQRDPVYKGELYAIYLLQEYQGRGIGRSLTRALVERLVQEGMNSMLLWVLAANPACRFYEAIGGQQVKTERIDIGGAMLDEVAYGWQNISMIVQEKQR